MKLNQTIHTGWRQFMGGGLIVFSLISAALYYLEMNTVGKAFNETANVVSIPSAVPAEIETAAAQTQVSPTPETDLQSGKVKLNSASQTELESLPQIGPSKAKAIINYRDQHPFKSIEELDKVKGIGPKTMEQLRPLIEL